VCAARTCHSLLQATDQILQKPAQDKTDDFSTAKSEQEYITNNKRKKSF
jgi:hypothetical protein